MYFWFRYARWAWNLRPPEASDITPSVITDLGTLQIRRRLVLRGLTNEYERAT